MAVCLSLLPPTCDAARSMPAAGRGRARMLAYIGQRISVRTTDDEVLTGRFLGFDRHCNVILSDCERERRAKKSGAVSRVALGFVVLRGCFVQSGEVTRSLSNTPKMIDSLSSRAASAPDGGDVAPTGAGDRLRAPIAGLGR